MFKHALVTFSFYGATENATIENNNYGSGFETFFFLVHIFIISMFLISPKI